MVIQAWFSEWRKLRKFAECSFGNLRHSLHLLLESLPQTPLIKRITSSTTRAHIFVHAGWSTSSSYRIVYRTCTRNTGFDVGNMEENNNDQDGQDRDEVLFADFTVDAVDEEEEDCAQYDSSTTHINENRLDEHRIIQEPKYIVAENRLRTLVENQVCTYNDCSQGVDKSSIQKVELTAAVKYSYMCESGHKQSWISTEYYGSKSAIHILIQIATLLSGLTFGSMQLFMGFMNVSIGKAVNYYKAQRVYAKAVDSIFSNYMTDLKRELMGESLVCLFDVRYDTPGFCAKKATAALMEMDTKKIIHIEIGDNRETDGISGRLENLLTERCLQFCSQHWPNVKEIITDASKTLINILGQSKWKFFHSLDLWHKAKNLRNILLAESRQKGCSAITPWIRDICNHFWYSCKESGGSVRRLRHIFLGVLDHIRNVHVFPPWRCRHDMPPPEPQGKKAWLSENSIAYKSIRKVLTSAEMLKCLPFYTRARTTSSLENFFSHTLLHYAPKVLIFGYDGYRMRCQLAVLDHNHHCEREPKQLKDGDQMPMSVWKSRRTKEWVAYQKLSDKKYTYINDLMAECMHQRYISVVGTQQASEDATKLSSYKRHPYPDREGVIHNKKQRLNMFVE